MAEKPMRYADARRGSRTLADRGGLPLGQDGPRDETGRSTLPAPPPSHPHTVRSYLGEDTFTALMGLVKSTRRPRKRTSRPKGAAA